MSIIPDYWLSFRERLRLTIYVPCPSPEYAVDDALAEGGETAQRCERGNEQWLAGGSAPLAAAVISAGLAAGAAGIAGA